MTGDNRMLGWCEHQAAIRGDGMLRSSGPVALTVTERGPACYVSLHWCDLNVEVRVAWWAGEVLPGTILNLFETDQQMLKVGDMPGPLPPVTVGSQTVGVPVGSFGARG